MSIFLGDLVIDDPVILAPMSGVTDLPYRRLVKRAGAGLVVSEMIASEAMIRATRRSLKMTSNCAEEFPMAVQLAGCEPEVMAEAARLNADRGAAIIDINFGCPVKKVVKRNGGSGCLRDLGLVRQIVRAVADATPLTTTAKIRSGYDQATRDPVAIGLACQEAGAQVICLHPRTRTDMYSGHARWDEIRALKEAVEVPVIGNGDVRSGEDARRMRDETGCDGIMIARGTHGDPWLFSQARAALDGLPIPPDPTVEERFRICLEHARNAIAFEENAQKAVIEFRKHLGWYTKGLPSGRELRQELFQVTSMAEMEAQLEGYLERYLAGAVAGSPG